MLLFTSAPKHDGAAAEEIETMLITVRLFARLRELCGGQSEIVVSLPAGADAADCFEELCALHAVLREQKPALAVAVNEEYAGWQTPLHAGDRVAFIPPVSGG